MPSSRRSSPRGAALLAAAVLVTAALIAAGCDGAASPSPSGDAAVAISVSEASITTSMAPGTPIAAYMTIVNSGTQADALLGASTSIAGSIELHQTSTDSSGMTGMHRIDRLEIPANSSVELKPGGYHFMLTDVANGALIAGSSIELDLEFERAGTVVVQIVLPQG